MLPDDFDHSMQSVTKLIENYLSFQVDIENYLENHERIQHLLDEHFGPMMFSIDQHGDFQYNSSARWDFYNQGVAFKNLDDAVLFRLMWDANVPA